MTRDARDKLPLKAQALAGPSFSLSTLRPIVRWASLVLGLSVGASGFAVLGCGGSAPLLHPAHTLFPGDVSMGAGLSAEVALNKPSISAATSDGADPSSTRAGSLQDLTVPLSVAPWVGARVGIRGDNEAGLTYVGRSIRVDGRHAWSLGAPTLSLGLGATAIMAKRHGLDADIGSVLGGGLDVPLLIGAKSKNDLYAGWFGVRGGFESLNGDIGTLADGGAPSSPLTTEEVSAQHYYVGVVLGLRVGFRHVHVALELDGAFHRAVGSIGGVDVGLSQLTLTPGGALIVSF